MLAMPGVTAAYHFRLYGTHATSRSERAWWKAHDQEIVDTMVAPNGPDVIALLRDRTSYGVYGDHGGARESVQRVPMVFWSKGMHGRSTDESFRTADVLSTILKAMGIKPTAPMDGRAHWPYR
jgi:arylsulfatase A-like enzyme